jgi:hypothetical protein
LPGSILGVALLSVLSARSLPAQSSNELNFASSLGDYRNLRRMLPDHVHRLAKDLLELRARKIASFARPEDIAARRAYVRERMTRGLGGFPERTPLDARVVGKLDRGDHFIEKIIFESQPHFYVTANLYLPRFHSVLQTRGQRARPQDRVPEAGGKGGELLRRLSQRVV